MRQSANRLQHMSSFINVVY